MLNGILLSSAAPNETPECTTTMGVGVGGVGGDKSACLNGEPDTPIIKRNLEPSFSAAEDDNFQDSTLKLKSDDGDNAARGKVGGDEAQLLDSQFAHEEVIPRTLHAEGQKAPKPTPTRTKDTAKAKFKFLHNALRLILLCLALGLVTMFNEHPESINMVDVSSNNNTAISPFEGSVFVIQAADEAYAAKKKDMMDANRQWASCMNYTYELKTIIKEGNLYAKKVQAINDALEAAKENDWIIFLDGDVAFQAHHSCDALEKIVPLQTVMDSEPCEFIAMTSPVTINTGVMLLKSTNATKFIVRKWLGEQHKPDGLLSFGAADQLSLQEVVLGYFLGDSYERGKCSSSNEQAQRNYCFAEHIPIEYRSAKHMCLIPCADENTLQCHDCGAGECNRTTTIFHHDTKKERYYAANGFG